LTSFRVRRTLRDRMKRKLFPLFPLVLAAAWLAVAPANAQTNVHTAFTNDAVANGYLQIQEQLHATQIAIEASRQLAAEESQRNADALAARLQSLEKTVELQRANEADAARKAQQLTLLVAGGFGLAGLGILLLMVWFQWRAFTQIAQISAQQHLAITHASEVHQLAAPGRATVEVSNARLLDVVSQLEKKIIELESGNRLLAAAPDGKSGDALADGQKFLDANQPHKALEIFEQFLTAQPDHVEALAKKAAALEKLGRLADALACCNQAIERNGAHAPVLLQKGGLLNKLNRHAEAIDCFEQALLAREKTAKA
jgi:tetratricopeptide (TPR) repeat protein